MLVKDLQKSALLLHLLGFTQIISMACRAMMAKHSNISIGTWHIYTLIYRPGSKGRGMGTIWGATRVHRSTTSEVLCYDRS